MKSFSYLFALVIGFNCFSQLTVKGSTPVVVSGNVLFVEDNIHLEKEIYFRNEAQLVQGSGTTGNTGSAAISIYQEGTVNHFNYNFWCAPVGELDNSVIGNTNFKLNLIDDPLLNTPDLTDSKNAQFVIFDEGSSSPLKIAEKWIYSYDSGSDYNHWAYAGSSNPIKPGLGFSMKGMGSDVYGNQTYDFRGRPNNGTITLDISPDTETLTGNPYPSALDALKFIHHPANKTALNGSLYYWEQAPGDGVSGSHMLLDYVGGYATYTISEDGSIESFVPAIFKTYDENGNENTTVGATSSSKKARRYIPVGQGFVVTASPIGGKITLDNSQRAFYMESGIDSEFFRTRQEETVVNSNSKLEKDLQRLRVYVDFNEEYSRELLMNFHPTFTSDFEFGLEAESPKGIESDAYWLQDEKPMVIKAVKFSSDMKIPLTINLSEKKNIRVRLAELENFNGSQSVFLNDSETGKYYSIKNDGYSFDDLEPGIYEDRFFITFQDLTLSDRELMAKKIKIFINYEKAVLTILNPELLSINEIRLFDLKGSAVIDSKNIQLNDKYEINLGRLSDGVYVASLRLEENKKVNQKLMIKKLR